MSGVGEVEKQPVSAGISIDTKAPEQQRKQSPEEIMAVKMAEAMRLLQEQSTELTRLRNVIARQTEELEAKQVASVDDKRSGVATVSRASTKARYAIVIEEAGESTDAQYVDVGVNGRNYRMNRGVVCEVPPEVIGVLKNAISGVARPNIDENGEVRGVRYRNTRRFPYRVLGKSIDETGTRVKTFELETPEYD